VTFTLGGVRSKHAFTLGCVRSTHAFTLGAVRSKHRRILDRPDWLDNRPFEDLPSRQQDPAAPRDLATQLLAPPHIIVAPNYANDQPPRNHTLPLNIRSTLLRGDRTSLIDASGLRARFSPTHGLQTRRPFRTNRRLHDRLHSSLFQHRDCACYVRLCDQYHGLIGDDRAPTRRRNLEIM
jgi:hypothetical protein